MIWRSGLICACILIIVLSGPVGLVASASDERQVSIIYTGDKGDFSYLQRAFQGLDRAQQDFAFSTREIPWNASAPADPVTNPNGTRSDAVIIMGAIMNGYEQKVTSRYPDTPVILIDGGALTGPEAKSIYFSMYGTSYLAGVLAANQTRTGKIGVIAGVDAPVLRGFTDGFIDGAEQEKPGIQVNISYIADDFSGFSMPEKAGGLTREMHRNGADIIYQIAGSSGTGVIQTAKTIPGLYVIGSDADQSGLAPETVMASAVKNLDSVIYDEMNDVYGGSYSPGTILTGLAQNGSSLVANPRFENLSKVVETHRAEAIEKEREYLHSHPVV